jgi:hypothetical protein
MMWVPSICTRRTLLKNGKTIHLGRWHCECGWFGALGVRDDHDLAKRLHEDSCSKKEE